MTAKLDVISLDSNIWKDHYFISFLQSNNSSHSKHICPIIVYLETRLWYDMNGLSLNDFDSDLQKLRTTVIDFTTDHIEFIIKATKKSDLPFRHHARDFMIGSITYKENSLLITNNIKNFSFLPSNLVMTPKDYLAKLSII